MRESCRKMVGIFFVALLALVFTSLSSVQTQPNYERVLQGRVVDRNGRPVAGVRIIIAELMSPPNPSWHLRRQPHSEVHPQLSAVTDSRGRFRIAYLPTERFVRLVVDAEQWVMESEYVCYDLRTVDDLTLLVQRAGAIEGRVRDEVTGQPASDVPVMCQWVHDFGSMLKVVSDKAGRYRMSRVKPGVYSVFVPAPENGVADRAAVPRYWVVVQEGKTTKGIDLTLTQGGLITGRVRDAATGQPLRQAWIVVSEAPWWRQTRVAYQTIVDAGGRFQVRVPPRDYSLIAYGPHRGYEYKESASPVTVAKGKTAEVPDFALSSVRQRTVQGQVLGSEGKPLADVVVTVEGRFGTPVETKTNESGIFVFDDLDATMDWRLRAGKANWGLKSPVTVISGGESEGNLILRLEPIPQVTVRGRVIDEHDNPVRGAQVTLFVVHRYEQGSRSMPLVTTLTDADGLYRFPDVWVNHVIRLEMQRTGYISGESFDAGDPGFYPTEKPSEDLVMRRADGIVRGVVLDHNGKPVAGADVQAYETYRYPNVSGSRFTGSETFTDAKGNFELRHLPAGTLSLQAEREGRRGEVDCRAGDRRVRISLESPEQAERRWQEPFKWERRLEPFTIPKWDLWHRSRPRPSTPDWNLWNRPPRSRSRVYTVPLPRDVWPYDLDILRRPPDDWDTRKEQMWWSISQRRHRH